MLFKYFQGFHFNETLFFYFVSDPPGWYPGPKIKKKLLQDPGVAGKQRNFMNYN